MPQGIEAAKGRVVRISANAPERTRVLVAWFEMRDPGREGTRKPYGGLLEMFVETPFVKYFGVPEVPATEVAKASKFLQEVEAHQSRHRNGLAFTENGEVKQVAKHTKAANLVIKRAPAGKRIIVPSQEVREYMVGNRKYALSKTASCTIPRFLSVVASLQLIGTMIRKNHPLRVKIAGKRYDFTEHKTGRETDPDTNLVADSGAWVITSLNQLKTDLSFVPEENFLAKKTMNM